MEQIEWIANKSVLFVILGLFYWPSAFSIFVSLVGFFFPSCLERGAKQEDNTDDGRAATNAFEKKRQWQQDRGRCRLDSPYTVDPSNQLPH